jgi:hypothetical protein
MDQKGPSYLIFFDITKHKKMQLSLFSDEQLKEIVVNAVESALLRHCTPKDVKSASDEWLTLGQLLVYDPLKRKKSTFYGYVNRRLIPFRKQGKLLLFSKSEIDEWLQKSRYPTIAEIEKRIDKGLSVSK